MNALHNGTSSLICAQEIRRSHAVLADPGQVVEVRALEASYQPHARYTETLAGYFDNIEDLLREVGKLHTAMGIYITLQPVHPDLLHRAKNKLVRQKRDYSTPDKYITSYRWLLIDSDPDRVSNISSTDQEHTLSLGQSRHIREELAQEGWPDPLEGDSGNGAHLLYPIDLEVTDADLVRRVLEGLAQRFDTKEVHIDTTVFNPSRICKLYGTLACKGDNTEERPHRLSRLLTIPGEITPVSRQQLEEIAAKAPAQEPQPSPRSGTRRTPEGVQEAFTAEKFLQKHAITVMSSGPYQGGKRYLLSACVWDPSHTDKSACVYQFADGRLGASCSHTSCHGKGWREFRLVFEPDAYAPKGSKKRAKSEQCEGSQRAANEGTNRNGYQPLSSDLNLCKFTADDAGNGDAMLALFGQHFLWCSSIGWFVYTGTHWRQDIDGSEVKQRAVQTLRMRRHAAVDAGIEVLLKCTKGDEGRVSGCLNRFKTLVSIGIDAFDNDPNLLNCQNGAIHLGTGQLTPHSQKQRFTYCLPVAYEPTADSSEWLDYLNGVVGGDPEVMDYLQMAVGYSLTGHTREEILFYLFGPTRSGKGTVAETIMALIPDPIATMVDFNTFTAKREGDVSNFDLAPLKPSRVIFASESNRYQSLNPAKIKQLTGGDKVRACFKHRDFFVYRPQFKVWMLSNYAVNGDPEDDALWGRVRVIEFPNSYLGKEDKTKKARLKEPEVLQGVLSWAVQGSLKWYALGPAGLTTPPAIVENTKKQRNEQDYVQQWLDACCLTDANCWVPNEVLAGSYLEWCRNNHVEYPKGPKALAQSLQAKGYTTGVQKKIAGANKKGVAGLQIVTGNDSLEVTGNECNGYSRFPPRGKLEIEKGGNHPLQALPVTETLLCRKKEISAGEETRHPDLYEEEI